MDKRYQVFVSSTYADLKEERQNVTQVLLEMDCIPAGMELFPATDQDQFEFIKRIIDDCDYYLLIIGGKYGSPVIPNGISYTEAEYNYAVEKGIPVIALLHESPDEIPFGKSEADPERRVQLQAFRDRVCSGRLVKFWKLATDLPGQVSLSLNKAIKQHPAVGWVRGNAIAREDILIEVNDLRKRNGELSQQLETVYPPQVTNLAGLNEAFAVFGTHFVHNQTRSFTYSMTWREIFWAISPHLIVETNEETIKSYLTKYVSAKADAIGKYKELDTQNFKTIGIQLKALGLIKWRSALTVQNITGLFWSLTDQGERLMVEIRTVKSGGSDALTDNSDPIAAQ